MALLPLACGPDKGRPGPEHGDDTSDTGAGPDSDLDGDGHVSLADGGDDCDDTDPATYPGAPEDCVGWEDTNCDNVTHLCELSRADYRFSGDLYAGLNVELLDDMDGDSRAEVLIGAWLTPPWFGGAYLTLSSSLVHPGGYYLEKTADCTFQDEMDAKTEIQGVLSMAKFGDIDGGGMADLVFAHVDDYLDSASEIFLVETEGFSCWGNVRLPGAADTTIRAEYRTCAGCSLAGADVDGDGRSALVVGAAFESRTNPTSGAVYILDEDSILPGQWAIDDLGPTIIEGTLEGQEFSFGGIASSDIDGDGRDDLAVGASAPGGETFLFLAETLSAGGVLSSSDADGTFTGNGSDAIHDLTEVPGDVDGDGTEELMIAAPFAEPTAVYLWYGSSSSAWGARSNSDADVVFVDTDVDPDYNGLGLGAGSVGDMDEDGRSDIVVYGGVVDDSGRANFFYGASLPASGSVDLATADARFASPAEASGSYMSGAVAGDKDVDGDGVGDLLLGDTTDNSAYLILGW